MTVTNALSTTPFCCGVPGAVYSKIILNSFLSDSLYTTLFSPVITSDNLDLDLMSFFQSFYPINNRFNLLILLFQKETLILCCFINHHPTLPNVVFLQCLVFSLMRCLNTFFLQDYRFYLHSSLGYFSVLFSPMSSSGNYKPCLSS